MTTEYLACIMEELRNDGASSFEELSQATTISLSASPTDPHSTVMDEVQISQSQITVVENSETSVPPDILDSVSLDNTATIFSEIPNKSRTGTVDDPTAVPLEMHSVPSADDPTAVPLEMRSVPIADDPTAVPLEMRSVPTADDPTAVPLEMHSVPASQSLISSKEGMDHVRNQGEEESFTFDVKSNLSLRNMVDNSEVSVQQDNLGRPPLDQAAPISSEISSESAAIVEEIEAEPLKLHNSPACQVPIAVNGEPANIQHQPRAGSSVTVSDVQKNSIITASEEIRKPENIAAPDKLKVKVERLQTKSLGSPGSSGHAKPRGLIDTAAPIESVKQAVSKFGGIVDWKGYKVQTLERRKHVEREFEMLQEELPGYRRRAVVADNTKSQVLTELDSTKRLIEELKLSLERAQTEEVQAKQDSELAQLRVKEMEEGIDDEASVAAKTQLEVAKARHEAAVTELKSVKLELEILKGEYVTLVNEKDAAVRKADEAVSASKEIEKTVEELTLELITTKESLEAAHALHLEAEEHRIGAALAKEQDSLNWEMKQKQAEEEVQRLNGQLSLAEDLKSKLDTASSLLHKLKAELAAYMAEEAEEILNEEKSADDGEGTEKPPISTRVALASTKKELEEVKANIEKAQEEVNCLKEAASYLQSELDTEKSALATMRQREGIASVAVSSLEAELNRTRQELELVLVKEKETRERMAEMPKLLQQAAQEADQAKSVAQSAREDLRRAQEEAELSKAGASTMESRLRAALKEIEASKASERLALAAVKALQESEQYFGMDGEDSPRGVTLPLEEYYMLGKRAHEAEEIANERVAAAIAQIEVAKDSELSTLERLEEAKKQMDERKESLRVATEKAEKAIEGKLGVEQELRKWRAEHKQLRADAAQVAAAPSTLGDPEDGVEVKKEPEANSTPDVNTPLSEYSSPETVLPSKPKKKKSFFPRILMFLARKKVQSLK